MTFTKEIEKTLKEAERGNFRVQYCKSQVIKIYSNKNRTEMHTLHPGTPGLRPLKRFIEKNS